MPRLRRQLLQESFQWIDAHLRATNLDVPDDLLSQWIYDEESDHEKPKGFYFSVFAYGCMQFEAVTSPLPPQEPRTVELEQLLQRFERWQLKLALAEIHRGTEVRVAPLPLFHFPEGEQAQFWPDTQHESEAR